MPNSAFDDFVNGLPNSDEGFDIAGELDQVESQPTNENPEGATPETDTDDEGDVPFNKNPKIKRFIERQIQKGLAKAAPQRETVIERQPAQVDDIPAEYLALYGDNEVARKAWPLQKKMYDELEARAEARVLEKIASQREAEELEVIKFQEHIESSLEDIEDEFGVDLSGSTAASKKARSEFLDLVQRLSPKDREGNVTSYADFHEVYDIYSKSRAPAADPSTPRKKALAARTMTRGSEAPVPKDEYVQGMGFEGIRQKLGIG